MNDFRIEGGASSVAFCLASTWASSFLAVAGPWVAFTVSVMSVVSLALIITVNIRKLNLFKSLPPLRE